MSSSHDSQKSSGWWIIPAAVVILALYVLSIGPLAWLERNGHLPNDPDHPVILTILVVYDSVLLFRDAEWFRWYVELWG